MCLLFGALFASAFSQSEGRRQWARFSSPPPALSEFSTPLHSYAHHTADTPDAWLLTVCISAYDSPHEFPSMDSYLPYLSAISRCSLTSSSPATTLTGPYASDRPSSALCRYRSRGAGPPPDALTPRFIATLNQARTGCARHA